MVNPVLLKNVNRLRKWSISVEWRSRQGRNRGDAVTAVSQEAMLKSRQHIFGILDLLQIVTKNLTKPIILVAPRLTVDVIQV